MLEGRGGRARADVPGHPPPPPWDSATTTPPPRPRVEATCGGGGGIGATAVEGGKWPPRELLPPSPWALALTPCRFTFGRRAGGADGRPKLPQPIALPLLLALQPPAGPRAATGTRGMAGRLSSGVRAVST
jgi:hypothetical protein